MKSFDLFFWIEIPIQKAGIQNETLMVFVIKNYIFKN